MEDSRTDIIPGESIPAVLVANLDPANAPPADRLRAQKRNMGKTVYIVEARGGEGKNEYGHAPGAIAAANTAIAAGYNACVLYYAWKDHEAVRATLLQKSVTGIVLLTGSLLPGFSQRRLDEIVAEAEVAGKSVGTNLAEVGVPVQPHTIVVCGPSGAGKGTLIARLLARFPTRFGFSVSHTTRAPRPGEVDGVHYHFVTQQAFDELVAHGEFVEHAQVHGNSYGTTRAAIEAVLAQGKACVLDIDVQVRRPLCRCPSLPSPGDASPARAPASPRVAHALHGCTLRLNAAPHAPRPLHGAAHARTHRARPCALRARAM